MLHGANDGPVKQHICATFLSWKFPSGGLKILTKPPTSSDPFHVQRPLSSSFNTFLLSSNVCTGVPSLTKIYFFTPNPPHKTVLFISFICFHIPHFLTTDSLLPHLQSGFHQYPLTKNVFPRSLVAFSPPNFSGSPPPSFHSPLPFNNVDHQSPGPVFLLGNISYVYSFLSISKDRTLGRPFSSTYFWSVLSLILLVSRHHVNLYKTLISYHSLIQ